MVVLCNSDELFSSIRPFWPSQAALLIQIGLVLAYTRARGVSGWAGWVGGVDGIRRTRSCSPSAGEARRPQVLQGTWDPYIAFPA